VRPTGDTPTLDDVRALLQRNGKRPVLLYIEAREKGPRYLGWPDVTFEQTQTVKYQRLLLAHSNTGVLLGVDNLCTIDCDTDAFLDALLAICPVLSRTLRTHGSRAGQFWGYFTGNRPRKVCPLKVPKDSPLAVGGKAPDKDGLVQVGEFRAEGGQSVIRGIHPNGCPYQWPCAEPPITLVFDTLPWPAETILPWQEESRYTFRPGGGGTHEQSSSDTELLQRAKERLSIDFLWKYFGFPEHRGNPTNSPFREDNDPSFSVYDDGQHFKDHGIDDQGDSFDFYQRATCQNASQAFVGFIELAGLGDELRRNRSDAKQEGSAETKNEQSQDKQPRIMIEVLRPSQVLAYKPPADLVLVGDYHLVRGTVVVVGGPPGVGKSRSTLALAEAGATQYEWFGLTVHIQFKTLIIQNENGLFRLQREIEEIGEPLLEECLRVCPPPPYGMCFWKQEFRDQLKRAADYFGPQAVALDPWNAIARDERAKDYLESFEIIRQVFPQGESGPVLVICAHTRKPTIGERANGRALLNLLAGSYVLGSVPRVVFIIQHASDEVTEDRIVWTCCKNNDGELGKRSAWVRQNGLFVPVHGFDWTAWDQGDKEGVFTVEDVPKILEKSPKGGLSRAKLAQEIAQRGVSRATAYRRIDEAEEAGLIKFQKGKGVYVISE
jgi:hypothetical protein